MVAPETSDNILETKFVFRDLGFSFFVTIELEVRRAWAWAQRPRPESQARIK